MNTKIFKIEGYKFMKPTKGEKYILNGSDLGLVYVSLKNNKNMVSRYYQTLNPDAFIEKFNEQLKK